MFAIDSSEQIKITLETKQHVVGLDRAVAALAGGVTRSRRIVVACRCVLSHLGTYGLCGCASPTRSPDARTAGVDSDVRSTQSTNDDAQRTLYEPVCHPNSKHCVPLLRSAQHLIALVAISWATPSRSRPTDFALGI
jgi:hypothetical protein